MIYLRSTRVRQTVSVCVIIASWQSTDLDSTETFELHAELEIRDDVSYLAYETYNLTLVAFAQD